MTELVVAETLLLSLLGLLVIALLRAYAHLERRVSEVEYGATQSEGGSTNSRMSPQIPGPPSTNGAQRATPAHDVVARTLWGDAVVLSFSGGGPNTLLAFLSSGCETCGNFWQAFNSTDGLPADARLVVVTRDSAEESPSRLMSLTSPGLSVLQSSAAWREFNVPASPYFVYIDGDTGHVHGEGSAEQWHQVKSLLSDALLDSELARGASGGQKHAHEAPAGEDLPRSPAAARAQRAEEALLDAGIPLDHPSVLNVISVKAQDRGEADGGSRGA